VVIDHGSSPDATGFGSYLRACIPEAWIVELVETDSALPHDLDRAFLVPKPVSREAWEAVLSPGLQQALTPHWNEMA
jgi:hypothetical protein